MKFKKQNQIISIVDNQSLYFVEMDSRGEKKVIERITLTDLLRDDADADLIPLSIKDRTNTLLIVPDHWLGNSEYKFQSNKKTLADAFVARNLKAQFPQQPEITYFFDCFFFQREHEERWLYAYFLQDPQFFQLYKTLSRLNLTPLRITSPAFILGPAIQKELSDFNDGGKCLIQLLPGIYNLYFFNKGNFLFSRSIPLTDSTDHSSDNFQAITYELNQSLYLFSQRAKAEVDHLYLLSYETQSINGLSEKLDREIINLNSILDDPRGAAAADASSEPVGYNFIIHLLLQNKFLFLTHKELKKELDWKPVQTAAMSIGLLISLLLGMESILLYTLSHQNRLSSISGVPVLAGETKQQIQQYNEALDVLLEEAERRSPREVLSKIANSLPPDVQMQEIILHAETNPSMDFKGVIKKLSPDHLKKTLSALIADLNQNIQPRKALVMPDVDFEFDKKKQNYVVKFKVEL